MLYFGEYHWLLVHGYSRFEALITPQHQKRHDVTWFLQMRYIAGGAVWRRVKSWERPSLWIEISSFRAPEHDWTDLGRIDFWDSTDDTEQSPPEDIFDFGGALDVTYYPQCGKKDPEEIKISDHLWRTSGFEGGLINLEWAALAEYRDKLKEEAQQTADVTTPKDKFFSELDSGFVRKRASLYIVENVPFGIVNVRVPRNSRDPETHALTRARQLIGVGEPEHIEVIDFCTRETASEDIKQDIYVQLHFNGYYED